jgi:Mg2+ and Co2+ transporter CorA
MFDNIIKKVTDKAGDLSEVKDDIILLRDEAQEVMREIGELQKLAMSLLMRQAKIIGALGRLKALVGID